MSVTMKNPATTDTVAIPKKKTLLLAECRATSSLSLGRRAPNLRRAKQMVGLIDEVCGELGEILDANVLYSLGLLIIFSLIYGDVRS